MSFVSVVVGTNAITVMSDGMESKEVDGKFVELNSEYKKFKKISDKQFIAFAGNAQICTSIANKYKFKYELYDLKEVAAEIQQELLQYPRNETKNQFIVGGVQNGKLLAYTLKNDGEIPELVDPEKSIKLAYMCSNHLDGRIERKITKTFDGYMKQVNNDSLLAQKLLNNLVADNDPTVNKKTKPLLIEL
ncbi:hypothetical protein COE01_14860 [Bacillus thuringiensis]|uniref:hypothetical protein n=1 Tax=Bacillus cereus group TaxID=86661 RepID=UPI0006AD658F|nr:MULTISPECIES: hypothetical protein [Bacillus cereus group]ALC52856.1 hypothetical protein ACN91_15090 [Bacillus cereus]PEW44420.1 hypothetical protein CN444_18215 [Bacillus thuringiensis]PFK07724.1 hypothetical protein COJ17_28145 [Bacillus thuringiensis]PGW83299.1 hypothetical protein COE01_14860 [Bacillus thuringiensis]